MKKPRQSLSFRVSLLIVAILLITSALLLAISNMYYWQTVYNPHVRKLNQLSFQNDELSALSASILKFLGSEEMEEVFRAQEAGEDAAVTEPLSRIPSMADPSDPYRSMLSDVMDLMIVFLPAWEHLELDEVYVEARKDGTSYHLLQNVVTDTGSEPMFLSFGREGTRFPGLAPEEAETPVLYRDENGARLVRCIPIRVDEWEILIWSAYDMDEFFLNHRHFLTQSILVILGMTVLASVAGVLLLRHLVTRRILCLARAAGDFRPGADGKYSPDCIFAAENGGSDEIGSLGREIRDMQERIVENTESLARMTAEKERISTELDLARRIQASALPVSLPPRPEFDLYATMTPALEVGGDFYDFFLVDEDHLALVIADVSGKGVPAALFMMVAKSLIQNQLMAGCDPAQAMERANLQLCQGNESRMFVTVWLAVLELSTGKGYACNAGHEKPGFQRAGGRFALLDYAHNLMAGALPKAKYRSRSFELQPGDCLFVYTDGVTEAQDAEESMFGEQRLVKALNENADAAPEEMIRGVRDAMDRFTCGSPQFDDITMMCLRYHGAGGLSPGGNDEK